MENTINILPAKLNDEDGKIIMNWRNDPITRKMSHNQNIKIWETFKEEYKTYFDNIPLFGTLNGEKIAFISYIKTNTHKIYKIGININPDYRGKGLSKKILDQSIIHIKSNYQVDKIIAEIKHVNIPSIKLFTNYGFILIERFEDYDSYEYICK